MTLHSRFLLAGALAVALPAAAANLATDGRYAGPTSIEDIRSQSYTMTEPVAGSDIPVDLTMVETTDGLYTPIGLRRPKGDGPFPMVLFFTGNGGGGMPWVRFKVNHQGFTLERFLEAGYAVGWLRYRAEVVLSYKGQELSVHKRLQHKLFRRSPLEYDDLKTIVEFVRALDYVDGAKVGLVGNSHGGEMILKLASEMDIAAGIASEPATHEYLALDVSNMPFLNPDQLSGSEPDLTDAAVVRALANKEIAMERIGKINSPIMILGRDDDHFQGLFRQTYDWLREAGKNAEWVSYDHPVHGYLMRVPKVDGAYRPDDMQLAAIDRALAFFGAHMPPAKTGH